MAEKAEEAEGEVEDVGEVEKEEGQHQRQNNPRLLTTT